MSFETQVHKIGVKKKPEYPDPQEREILEGIHNYLKLPVEAVKIIRAYTVHKSLIPSQLQEITEKAMADSVTETGLFPLLLDPGYDWCVEVSYKEGLTDNAGNTAQITLEDFLKTPFSEQEKIHSSTLYLLKGRLSHSDVRQIAVELLANPLIEEVRIREMSEQGAEEIPINLSDEALESLSRDRHLALNLQEMRAIRDHFGSESVRKKRAAANLPPNPTDVELEVLAQTWSEHCKHKIFNAEIRYSEEGKTETIRSLFRSYIKKATDEIAKKKDWLVSVFSDNAGIIRLNATHNLAFKVETHNSPSALDPYGGALTGILGVNRDILGAGIGARLLANTDVFCFAEPDYDKPIPERLLHPKRIFEGVRKGVEHGGNKSGVPTVNGAIVFDNRYLGKPLVYCGTVGIMPAKIGERRTEQKEIHPGDRIIIAGGRTGKDGIHGATFSSEELHEKSPTGAVQIGDPFTQKKLADFILEARDKGLFRTLTDNGAGGFSSSIGELALLSGGCEVHLERAPLKYSGMHPWEIFVSESQERMTLAAPIEHWNALKELAELHEVEIADLGAFTSSGMLHVLYRGQNAAYLDLEFLHEGVPVLQLEAEWEAPKEEAFPPPKRPQYGKELHAILSRYNVCSKEPVIRQYDHEVQGSSALKPLTGVRNDGPSDAALLRPIECLRDPKAEKEAVAVSNGICPKYSDIDAYHMAACAIDEAVRNQIAVGADPEQIAILDNFCWPDPVYDPVKTTDGKRKCAQLVRANRALYDVAVAYGTPIISGKDSMKNDYKMGGVKISVPPTLLVSAIGKVPDVEKTVSMDVKSPGDLVFLLGMTRNELGGTEFALQHGLEGGIVPKLKPQEAMQGYRAYFQALQQDLIRSCHDCSDGGLAAALAEMAFAGELGLEIDPDAILCEENTHDHEKLFSETPGRLLFTAAPENRSRIEALFAGLPLACIGVVAKSPTLQIGQLIHENIFDLKQSWQRAL